MYGRPPWRLAGRALAIWCRLDDPDEARRHVPDVLEVDRDPVVRLRFWDLIHDAGLGDRLPVEDPAMATVREAVVAIPARFREIEADIPAYMYADDPAYIAFGRETMGWPLRDGRLLLTEPWPSTGLGPGVAISALLERHGRSLLRATLTLGQRVAVGEPDPTLPRWFAVRRIPDLTGPGDAICELALTGPSAFQRGPVIAASAEVEVGEAVGDELRWLRPREILGAELWSDVELTLGYGRQLADLRVTG